MDLATEFKMTLKIFACCYSREEFLKVFWYMQKYFLYLTRDSATGVIKNVWWDKGDGIGKTTGIDHVFRG